MFSKIKASESLQIINFDSLSRIMKNERVQLQKQKKNEIESGLSVSSFIAKKNGVTIHIFIMCLSPNNIICSGYHKGKLVGQKQVRGQSQLPQTIFKMFNGLNGYYENRNNDLNLGNHIQKLRVIALNKEKDYHNYMDYSQVLKFSPEYLEYVKFQKASLQKIAKDSQKLIDDKNLIRKENGSLMEPLLQIELNKQNLESIILSFENERHYLANPKQRFEEQITQKKKIANELTQFFQDEQIFNTFIHNLTEIKSLEVKLKSLAL